MGDMTPFLMLMAAMGLLPVVVFLLAWRTGHAPVWLLLIGGLALGVWSAPALWAGHDLIGNTATYTAIEGVIALSAAAFLGTTAIGLVLVCKRWNGVPRW